MTKPHSQPLTFILLLSLYTLVAHAADFWRADQRSPEVIKASGGFKPRAQTTPGVVAPDLSLWNHALGKNNAGVHTNDNDGYVSTSADKDFTLEWAQTRFGTGWVYRIHAAPNLIDVLATLDQYARNLREQEYAAIGGIKLEQIISWIPVVNGDIGKEVKNPAYNRKLFKKEKDAGAQPQLAGFPSEHRAWGEEPWRKFATCVSPRGRVVRSLTKRETCTPKKGNVEVGKEWVAGMYK